MVTLCEGVGVEIAKICAIFAAEMVTLCEGVGVEISQMEHYLLEIDVTLCEGVGVEMNCHLIPYAMILSRFARAWE